MSAPQTRLVLTDLASRIANQKTESRLLVAMVGAPGSGKSTMADCLQDELAHTHQCRTQVIPMDGFHYDDRVLEQLGRLGRKGAPDTFDVVGLDVALRRVKNAFRSEDVAIPIFDRSLEISRAGARIVSQDTEIVIVEGNYLLLNRPPWDKLRSYFDFTTMIICEEAILRNRLLERWSAFDIEENDAVRKVDENDLPNARLVTLESQAPQFTLMTG
ncbi:nucleoside/nucleotide kinase family protein [Shimia sagamensis]|uniref:Phosphoribulokinase/uridine kinase domain-containing protein n=1 Tax=Shimia sagamensis TaxID=1566352 RepID=A0ABY1NXH4_9RHOB|nr:nucleoside/nucleotide kinase family protein [Shimia sagamensis]SMP21294.1 hypothetical protein SAMN06265373_1049 [Shimia sagamensis]